MAFSDDKQERFEALKLLYSLWSADNGILNQKVAQFLTVNSILLATRGFVQAQPDSRAFSAVVSLWGFLLAAWWFASLQRTLAFRRWWQAQIVLRSVEFNGLCEGSTKSAVEYASFDLEKDDGAEHEEMIDLARLGTRNTNAWLSIIPTDAQEGGFPRWARIRTRYQSLLVIAIGLTWLVLLLLTPFLSSSPPSKGRTVSDASTTTRAGQG